MYSKIGGEKLSKCKKSSVSGKLKDLLLKEFLRLCSSKPVRISERELARRYETTAITVHSVCLALAEIELLIHLPGKRGYFINPDFGAKEDGSLSLGVICRSSSSGIYFFGRAFQILSALCERADVKMESIFFLPLRSDDVDEIAAEMRRSLMRSFVWIEPEKKDIPLFNALVRSGLPLVAIAPPFDTDMWTPPEKNALIRDYYAHGRYRALAVIKNKCRRPLYIGADIPGGTFSGFRDMLAEEGIPFSDQQRFEFDATLPRRIAASYRSLKADCIVANGLIRLFIQKILEREPEIASLPFFLEDGVLDSEPYSQLKIIRTMNFKQLHYGAADAALKQMKLLTSGKISEFDNIILSAAEKKAAGKIITK